MKEFKLNPLHYVSLSGYNFDCLLMSSGVTFNTLQDKQMIDDFVGAKRGGICGIMGDRYINNSDGKSIWYIDANNKAASPKKLGKGCINQMLMTLFSDLKIYEVALLIILWILLKLKLKLKLKVMILSTPELSMSVQNVMKNVMSSRCDYSFI